MFWGKKPDYPGVDSEKPVISEGTSSWSIDSGSRAPEASAWEKLEVKVLSASEIEAMLAGRFGKVRSALGVGTLIQGRLSFDTPVRIDGKLSGEVFSSEALIVGSSGVVDAQLEVAVLIVMGTVKGKIKASQRVEVYAGGRLEAEVIAPVIKIEEGAHFGGKCSMPAQAREQQKERDGALKNVLGDKAEAKGGSQPGKTSALDEAQLH